ncbi:CidA/LrgA family protein [Kineococcus terrestris]|uniref:CidA/LrgA family protein n=1 Tax=Kineococcus terrestris TaxID=2044856 RepID=UPI0034DABC3C
MPARREPPPAVPAPGGWGAHVPAVLAGLALLLALQLAGTALVVLLGLPVPGAVVGLVALVVLAARSPALRRRAEPGATPLLQHLQLLFVPPGVGAVTQLDRLAADALPLTVAVVGSFALGLVVAGVLLQALLRRRDLRAARGAAS